MNFVNLILSILLEKLMSFIKNLSRDVSLSVLINYTNYTVIEESDEKTNESLKK